MADKIQVHGATIIDATESCALERASFQPLNADACGTLALGELAVDRLLGVQTPATTGLGSQAALRTLNDLAQFLTADLVFSPRVLREGHPFEQRERVNLEDFRGHRKDIANEWSAGAARWPEARCPMEVIALLVDCAEILAAACEMHKPPVQLVLAAFSLHPNTQGLSSQSYMHAVHWMRSMEWSYSRETLWNGSIENYADTVPSRAKSGNALQRPVALDLLRVFEEDPQQQLNTEILHERLAQKVGAGYNRAYLNPCLTFLAAAKAIRRQPDQRRSSDRNMLAAYSSGSAMTVAKAEIKHPMLLVLHHAFYGGGRLADLYSDSGSPANSAGFGHKTITDAAKLLEALGIIEIRKLPDRGASPVNSFDLSVAADELLLAHGEGLCLTETRLTPAGAGMPRVRHAILTELGKELGAVWVKSAVGALMPVADWEPLRILCVQKGRRINISERNLTHGLLCFEFPSMDVQQRRSIVQNGVQASSSPEQWAHIQAALPSWHAETARFVIRQSRVGAENSSAGEKELEHEGDKIDHTEKIKVLMQEVEGQVQRARSNRRRVGLGRQREILMACRELAAELNDRPTVQELVAALALRPVFGGIAAEEFMQALWHVNNRALGGKKGKPDYVPWTGRPSRFVEAFAQPGSRDVPNITLYGMQRLWRTPGELLTQNELLPSEVCRQPSAVRALNAGMHVLAALRLAQQLWTHKDAETNQPVVVWVAADVPVLKRDLVNPYFQILDNAWDELLHLNDISNDYKVGKKRKAPFSGVSIRSAADELAAAGLLTNRTLTKNRVEITDLGRSVFEHWHTAEIGQPISPESIELMLRHLP